MFITLNRKLEQPLYVQLYEQIKHKILVQDIASHEKLPSKRELKNDLGISMTTVEHAYAMLVDEDLIYAKPKSGYYATAHDGITFESKAAQIIKKPNITEPVLPLGTIDTSIIQSATIQQIAKEIYADKKLFNKGDSSGEDILKQAIYNHIHEHRGVTCSIDQIVVGPSTEFLLDQLMHLLDFPKISIEDPGYPVVKKVLKKHRIDFDAVKVESNGIDVDDVSHPVVHITPSHQFPTGAVLSLQKRIQLLQRAEEGYVIEDDYDSEFRYEGRPLPSLHSLDQNDRTIYMTTFSKVLFPSLRLACMVLPKALIEKYYQQNYTCDVPRHLQHIVAKYINGGYLNRHINRVRKIYRQRMLEVLEFLGEFYPEVEVSGAHTGMHILLRMPGEDLELRAGEHRISSLNDYAVHKHYEDTIVIGTGEASIEEIKEILKAFFDNKKAPGEIYHSGV